jgi:hypothetical protein
MATTKVGGGVVDLNSDNTSFKMPVGSSLYSGTPVTGMIRNNSSISNGIAQTTFEYYNGTSWVGMSGPPLPDLEVDYLVVAGGGGGYNGGAGGAGGLRTSFGSTSGGGCAAESTLTSIVLGTAYNVTVGGGAPYGQSGNSSSFDTVSTTGGGYGFRSTSTNGGSGGSGGAGGSSGGANVACEGFRGGTNSNTASGAGGGGAGAAGQNQTNSDGGNGGVGLAVNILNATDAATASVGEVSGSDVYYAGGGGGADGNSGNGGTGGLGGGGNGAYTSYQNGTANTGGGGGSALAVPGALSGDGGSGVVILRYSSFYTITVGAGITQSSGSPFTNGTDKVSVLTAGTGTITFN